MDMLDVIPVVGVIVGLVLLTAPPGIVRRLGADLRTWSSVRLDDAAVSVFVRVVGAVLMVLGGLMVLGSWLKG